MIVDVDKIGCPAVKGGGRDVSIRGRRVKTEEVVDGGRSKRNALSYPDHQHMATHEAVITVIVAGPPYLLIAT